MKRIILLCAILSMNFSIAQQGIPVPGMTACDTDIQNFMSTFGIPSVTMALAKDGELKYMRSFGIANIAATEPTQPYHIFRIASVSKPITSIGIMKMIEDGLISLDDTVFGSGGILENHWYFSNSTIIDTDVYNITVQMLLEHSAGWDRNVNCFPDPTSPYPWFFGGCDPIIAPLHITESQGEINPVKEEFLINYLLEKSLNFTPGTQYAYSNMGYLVLSEIIEEVSGQSYEAWMQQEIFEPLGIYDMHIGENLLADKREREGEYLGNGFTTLDLYGSGNVVPWEYGGFALDAMDGHGGWTATARDLVRLLVAVDGFATKPDILSPSTISSMTMPSANNAGYAKGWQVNGANNWWHSGAVDGTASFWVRSNSGYTWAIVLNERVVDGNANAFWTALDAMGWNCIAGTTNFPDHDLMDSPTVNASALTAVGDQVSEMNLSWANGNGTARIAVMKDITNNTDPFNFLAYPLDGTDYNANAQFGSGDNLGDGTYVVYNGTGNTVNVTGLDPTKQYAIRVYELTKNANNGNNALYLLGNPADVEATLSLNEAALSNKVTVFPTITSGEVNVQVEVSVDLDYRLFDLQGRSLKEGMLQTGANTLTVSELNAGVYVLAISRGDAKTVKRIIRK
ncbi:serine hydrolase [Aureisphaera galaxeae]|uniref:serine hydrolase n=1 Tax=Aureisphaera galaxeae TaxID=1538023 RepID=UPI0023502B30|nr:serine hydrolase [Aureisphaera galaxeae]MDC8002941.1 serine hydrolase [Aureisphaera galaxeae]